MKEDLVKERTKEMSRARKDEEEKNGLLERVLEAEDVEDLLIGEDEEDIEGEDEKDSREGRKN